MLRLYKSESIHASQTHLMFYFFATIIPVSWSSFVREAPRSSIRARDVYLYVKYSESKKYSYKEIFFL